MTALAWLIVAGIVILYFSSSKAGKWAGATLIITNSLGITLMALDLLPVHP